MAANLKFCDGLELTYDNLFRIDKGHWLEMMKNEPDLINDMIQSRYKNFYIDSQLDTEKFKASLIQVKTESWFKAKELFKTLNYFPHKYIGGSHSEFLLENIVELYGSQILAHGVEESKGGRNNLLLMAIANCVCISPQYWGPLLNGAPSIVSLSHGPYYVVYTSQASERTQIHKNPSLDEVESIVVPFKENILELMDKINVLKQAGLIDDIGFKRFTSKLETYDGFKKRLDLQQASKNLIQYSGRHFTATEGKSCVDDNKMEVSPASSPG